MPFVYYMYVEKYSLVKFCVSVTNCVSDLHATWSGVG